jgi:hypothetical protein
VNGEDVLKTGFAFCFVGAIAKIVSPTGPFYSQYQLSLWIPTDVEEQKYFSSWPK